MALARAVIWLRYPILLVWIAGAVALVTRGPVVDLPQGDPSSLVSSNARAVRAAEHSVALFRYPLLTDTAIVQHDPRGLSDGALSAAANRAHRISNGGGGPVSAIVPVPDAGTPLAPARSRPTTIVTYVFTRPDATMATRVGAAQALARSQAPSEHVVGVAGPAPARLEQARAIDHALPFVTAGTVLLIVIVIGVWQRTLLAPLIALGCAGLAYVVAVRVAAVAGPRLSLQLPREAVPLVLVLLLGIVTDYTVFLLAEARRFAAEPDVRPRAAVVRGLASAGPIILTAGLIVTLGTATLALGSLAFFRAVGPLLALTAAIGTLVSVTLAPAVVAILGGLVLRPRRERSAEEPARAPSRRSRLARSRFVAIPLVVACGAILVGAALNARDAKLSLGLTDALASDSAPARAAAAASHSFPPGITGPAELLVEAPSVASKTGQLARLESGVRHTDGVAGVAGPADAARVAQPGGTPPVFLAPGGDAARLLVVYDADPTSARAIADHRALVQALPHLLDQAGLTGARTELAGPTALAVDTVDQSTGDAAKLALAALAVNFVFLVIFLRALVAPVLLLAVSVLALSAALGVLVLASRALGLGDIAYFVPIAAAVLLLSLGSDYNVFVVGRIWDEAEHRPVADAVATAAPRAASSISVAGTVLAGSFALLALTPVASLRQLALVLAVGVLLDTFVVRSLLVPALLTTFGPAAGWPGRRLRDAPLEVAPGERG
jgi:putative drug exporter of the RND superfamily